MGAWNGAVISFWNGKGADFFGRITMLWKDRRPARFVDSAPRLGVDILVDSYRRVNDTIDRIPAPKPHGIARCY